MMTSLETEILSFENHPARDLDLAGKDFYLKGLSLVIAVDKEIHPKEVEYLKILVETLEMGREGLDELLDFGKAPSKDALREVVEFPIESPEKRCFWWI